MTLRLSSPALMWRKRPTPNADYRYRAFLPREVVAARLSDAIGQIDYPNFKGSIWEQWRHDVYIKVWRILANAQKQIRL